MLPASPSLAIPAAGSFTFSAWVRADQPAGEQLIYARRDAGNSLLVGINQGVPFVEVNGQRSQPGQPLAPAAWQHVAVTADGSKVNLYVNGRVSSSLAASLPPLNTVAALGGDVPAPAAAPAAPPRPPPTVRRRPKPRPPVRSMRRSWAPSTKCACPRSPAPPR